MANPLKQLAGETAIYGFSSILARILNFLFVPIYTRTLTQMQYGVVTEFMSYIAILQVILVGTKGMFITPASRIREGLMLSSNVPFRLINMILMILAFIGLVLVVVMNLRARTKDKDAGTEISVSEA